MSARVVEGFIGVLLRAAEAAMGGEAVAGTEGWWGAVQRPDLP
ncbi:hypothetical protein ABZ178_32430 [Streptomyces massasporeus]|nr:hypothetical protein [Streptomyces massasporeus]GGV88483.1 hypothetical protein GCM10010228_72690 [Streptomyces massasporeus]